MQTIEPNGIYTPEEAAKALGISTQTMVILCREGKIKSQKVKGYIILGQSILDWLQKPTHEKTD